MIAIDQQPVAGAQRAQADLERELGARLPPAVEIEPRAHRPGAGVGGVVGPVAGVRGRGAGRAAGGRPTCRRARRGGYSNSCSTIGLTKTIVPVSSTTTMPSGAASSAWRSTSSESARDLSGVGNGIGLSALPHGGAVGAENRQHDGRETPS